MTVYVDDMRARFGRMIMCHMIADSDEELHAMADRIGVARRWHQAPPRHDSHYDIALSKRALAIEAGAVAITWRELAMLSNERRRTGAPLLKPADVPVIEARLQERVAEILAEKERANADT